MSNKDHALIKLSGYYSKIGDIHLILRTLGSFLLYHLLIDVYFEVPLYSYKIIKRDPSSAPILIFIVSLIMSAVISIADTNLANEILTYTFFLLVFGVLWKFIILVREGEEEVDTSI